VATPNSIFSAKERLVLAAEKLFARHGIDGVSLRQIGADAGHANSSAVQYHFGSKDELVQAIFEHRLGWLTARRQELLDERGSSDLRAWLECQVWAIMEQAEQPGSHYLRFLAELQRPNNRMPRIPEGLRAPIESFHERLRPLMGHLPEPLRRDRVQHAEMFMVLAAAAHEAARESGEPSPPTAVAVGNLVDGMVGFLEAPCSPGTKAATRRGPVPGAR
jgi:AcrR family transcriptional regulator